jgi:SAM-dependent methyltransferase
MPPSDSTFYSYGQLEGDVFAAIRRETYGEDLGQFSWITADELRRLISALSLTKDGRVLDVACGSGGLSLFITEMVGCQMNGIDINESGIATAREIARARGLQALAHFQQADAAEKLPFEDATFNAITSIDAMNHLASRAELLREWWRVLRPGCCFLFTDAAIITGTLSRDEMFARSNAMGQFLFTPAGVHEKLIQNAGFVDLHVEDLTDTIAAVSQRWHDAREKRRTQLLQIEKSSEFETLQGMLAVAHTLASERRLSRFAYIARKPQQAEKL